MLTQEEIWEIKQGNFIQSPPHSSLLISSKLCGLLSLFPACFIPPHESSPRLLLAKP